MYEIAKSFRFDAAHHLPKLPEGHKCRRPHGHTYTVTFILASTELDGNGFVVDYGELDRVKLWIATTLDHRDLAEEFAWPTTAENLARWLYLEWRYSFPLLVAVRVSETPDTYAEYCPGGKTA
jgi:6-pyruvoyltetrahydropterin/6-carboxytetrahydropterin synthase